MLMDIDILPRTFINVQTIVPNNVVIRQQRFDNPSNDVITITVDGSPSPFGDPTSGYTSNSVRFKIEQHNFSS